MTDRQDLKYRKTPVIQKKVRPR